MGRACGPKGIADRAEPGRSRQAGLEDPRPVRPERASACTRGLRCEHARLASVRAAHPGDPEDPLPEGPRRRKPAKIHADKAYDIPDCHRALRERRIRDRIARRGIESSARLGRHRWVIERTIAWLGGYCRLTLRYERYGHLFAVFLALAAALTCYKKIRC
nr:hypothetical protein GCM10025732_29970 [Glycomyces mayteni]